MTLLPVVERELRVAARERNTYRVRFLAALITTGFSIFSLWFVTVFKAGAIPPRDLFLALTWIEFVLLACSGFMLTCDSISEEKRDSTLGLLFLTDLKGYDVVLGKFFAGAIRGLYALVGTLPVLALPLMMGGTDLVEFARTAVTLLTTLFFTMAIGLAFSSILRKGWTALTLSGVVVLFFVLILPLYSQMIRRVYGDPVAAQLIEMPSPTYALMMSYSSALGLSTNQQGWSLLISVMLGIAAIGVASVITPHVWKDHPPKRRAASVLEALRALRYGTVDFRKRFRERLLEINPVFWLSRRETVASLGLLLVTVAGGLMASHFARRDWSYLGPEANAVIPLVAWTFCAGFVHLMILLRLPVVAAERFGEDRRSGALELLLSTPLSLRRVLRGHWLALGRYFCGPALIALLLHLLVINYLVAIVPAVEGQTRGFWQLLGEIWSHIFYTPHQGQNWMNNMVLLVTLILLPLFVLNWIALGWMSTWLSLRVKRALVAPIAAIVVIHLPPAMLFGITAAVLEDNHWLPDHDLSASLVLVGIAIVFLVAQQILCSWWGRRQLYKHFRTAATDRYQPPEKTRWWQMRIA